MENKKERSNFTISILGDSRVGKTKLIHSYFNGTFDDIYVATCGSDYMKDIIKINGKNYQIKIIDTPGQERYQSIARLFIKNCQIIILVYDISNRSSFENLKNWVKIIEDYRGDKCAIGIIGNKNDLYEKKEVTDEESIQFANNYNFPFYLSSAKTNNNNLKELITQLIEIYLCKYLEKEEYIWLEIEDKSNERINKYFCYYSFGEIFKARVFPWY